jgi:protein-L-isoaspartate(D-aspartate) O-methyltransferase
MTDFAAARRHMVDGQIRTNDVTDLRVLFALDEVPRERFLPPSAVALAYLDLDVPVGNSRRLLKPMVLAKLLQAAGLHADDRVLDVGSGTGYSAAIIARIASQVVALEQETALSKIGSGALPSNVRVVCGPLTDGWVQDAPYDVIVLEGSTEVVPQTLCQQLKDGGRLVCVLGSRPGSRGMLYRRSGDEVGSRPIFDASAAVLPGFAKKPVFAF